MLNIPTFDLHYGRLDSQMDTIDRLLQYGVSDHLANYVNDKGLSVTKIRALSQRDLVAKFELDEGQASKLKKCVQRQPIEQGVAELLLSRANHTCCVCKGQKGEGVILHHIVEYERSQNNDYNNLAVLCPSDHDRAHSSGLSLGLSSRQICSAKESWEREVEINNARRAAQAIDIEDDGIDYVNVMRIEQMCLQRFKAVPATSVSAGMVRAGILTSALMFDEKYVRKHLSGRYLFDYINSSETEHYRQLMVELSKTLTFADLSEAARSGIRKLQALEGRYAFFIGGVTSKHPGDTTAVSVPFEWRYKTTRVEIRWDGDAEYLMSQSARGRQGRTNRYIVYGMVRTVHKPSDGAIQVTCSPLLAAQPKAYVDRTPSITWRR